MEWTTEIPTQYGWYWVRRNVKECPEINNAPFIVFVGSDLHIRTERHDYGVNVADAGFDFWCGPLLPPTN